jgi:4-amino-4-deoxy-L-arabinose transferase-like glycosyltransferase
MPWARTSAIRTRVGRALGAAERLAGTRRGAVVLVVAALAVYAFESWGWPLQAGRDLGVYLRYYAEIGQSHPVFPWAMLSRTPVTPVVSGLLLGAGGGLLAEAVMGILFALSVLAWSSLALRVGGRRSALLVAVALVVFPGYGGVFHELSSDAVYAAAFAAWAYLLTRAVERRSYASFALAGAWIGVLALTRPVNQTLLLIAPLLLVVPGAWRDRIGRAVVFAAAGAVVLVAWSGYNDARYGDFTVARGGNASIPFFRAFVTDRIVSPDNGPASRELAAAVQTHLLPLEPYRSYGITLHEFFTSGSARMEEDLISLSDRVFGWSSNYSVLGRAAREAVLKHPWTYTRGVATSFWQELSRPLFVPEQVTHTGLPKGNGPGITVGTTKVRGKTLPKPSEGEPIPASRQGDYVSTPDGHIREVWRSPIDHGVVFDNPRDQRRYEALNRRLSELGSRLPSRGHSAWLHLQLNRSSKVYPPAWAWLLVGLAALVWRRPAGWRAPLILAVAGLGVLFATVLGVYSVPEYAVPVVPAFVLLAGVGLLGRRAAAQPVRADAREAATLRHGHPAGG